MAVLKVSSFKIKRYKRLEDRFATKNILIFQTSYMLTSFMTAEMLSSYCKLSLFLCVFASFFDKTDIRERSLPVALHSMISGAIH